MQKEIKKITREDLFKDISIEIGRVFSECNNIKKEHKEVETKIEDWDVKVDEYFLQGRDKAVNHLKRTSIILENNNAATFQKILNIQDIMTRIENKLNEIKK